MHAQLLVKLLESGDCASRFVASEVLADPLNISITLALWKRCTLKQRELVNAIMLEPGQLKQCVMHSIICAVCRADAQC